MAFFENVRSGFYRCSGSVFFQKNAGFKYGRTTHKELLEETLTKRNYMDVKTGVKHFTNPGNHENPCFLYFVKTLFN